MGRRAIARAVRTRVFRGWWVALAVVVPRSVTAQEDFEAFKKKEAERLRGFISKDDAAFSDFLKQDWRDFALSLANKPLVRPKPTAPPVAPPRTGPAESRPVVPAGAPAAVSAPDPRPVPPPAAVDQRVPAVRTVLPPAPATAPAIGPVRGTAPDLAKTPSGSIGTAFYGALVSVPKIEMALRPIPAVLTREALSAFWEQISAAPTATILSALQRYREQMALGDWPYAQLAYATALALANGDTTSARLIAWHLLVKSGYAVRIGFSESKVHLLVKSEELLYGVSFFTTDQGRYYALDPAGTLPPQVGAIRTYDGDHPGARKPLVFQMAFLPALIEERQPRTVRFSYANQTFSIEVGVNRNLIRLLANYPQTTLQGYLNADLETPAMQDLVAGLKPVVAGRPELETVEVILRFVQTAFDYKTDGEQFRREKWMFPEETLFYPYSDCEDRAILFSYLVRKLVPVGVVGLIYADHVATAIRFNTEVPGDTRVHRGARYVVSDPTYINARVGMEMEQYRHSSPTIVDARPLP